MDHHKRILELQMLPKRMMELQKQCNDYKIKLDQEKERTKSISTYWKNKTSEISTKNQDLSQRLEVFLMCIYIHLCVLCVLGPNCVVHVVGKW